MKRAQIKKVQFLLYTDTQKNCFCIYIIFSGLTEDYRVQPDMQSTRGLFHCCVYMH